MKKIVQIGLVWLAVFVVIVVSLLGVAELVLRIQGFSPSTYKLIQLKDSDGVRCTPPDFWMLDSIVGFKYRSGSYDCMLNGMIEFKFNQDIDGSRLTGSSLEKRNNSQSMIHLYGCSVAWGHGLNDNQTCAWILQDSLPNLSVRNYGVGAWSTVQCIQYFKQQLCLYNRPDKVVLLYGFFHHMRNTISWVWRKQMMAFSEQSDNRKLFEQMCLPKASLEIDGGLNIEYLDFDDMTRNIPGTGKLCVINYINDIYQSRFVDSDIDSEHLEVAIIREFNSMCQTEGIELIVAGVLGDENTLNVLQLLSEDGIAVVDVSVDLSDSKWRIHGDGHPNEAANLHFANCILKEIR